MTPTDEGFRLLKHWSMLFAGWQLGSRSEEDQQCRAVRDHRDLTMFLRAEVNAITELLVRKGLVTLPELQDAMDTAALRLGREYERRFPGFRATPGGLVIYDRAKAAKTMEGWPP